MTAETLTSTFPTLASITLICLFAGQIFKATPLSKTWIPILTMALGGVLGITAFETGIAGSAFPATNPLDAICVGLSSGLAATGVFEVFKQYSTKEGE